MKTRHLYWLCCITILLLTITNLVTFYAYIASARQGRQWQHILKTAPKELKEKAVASVREYQETARRAFLDLVRHMSLFRELSEESETKLLTAVEERNERMQGLHPIPSKRLPQAEEIIELDDHILSSFIDYGRLQSAERNRLANKLGPLAEALGFVPGKPPPESEKPPTPS